MHIIVGIKSNISCAEVSLPVLLSLKHNGSNAIIGTEIDPERACEEEVSQSLTSLIFGLPISFTSGVQVSTLEDYSLRINRLN